MTKPPYRFGVCRDDATYREVLKLRRLANLASGKAAGDPSPEDWADEWDARSDIVTARGHDGNLLASIRITINEPGDAWWYARYTDSLPASTLSLYAESSRLCVHPEYRGGRLAAWMGAFMCIQTWRLGRSRIVGCCSADLLRFWSKWGLQPVGMTIPPAPPIRIEEQQIVEVDLGTNPPINPHASTLLQALLDTAWVQDLE